METSISLLERLAGAPSDENWQQLLVHVAGKVLSSFPTLPCTISREKQSPRRARTLTKRRLAHGHYPDGSRGTGDPVASGREGAAADSRTGNPRMARPTRGWILRDGRGPRNAGIAAHTRRSPGSPSFGGPPGTNRRSLGEESQREPVA